MNSQDLLKIPTNTTAFPFQKYSIKQGEPEPKRRKTNEDDTKTDFEDSRKQIQVKTYEKRNSDECWFCLSNTNLERHLIVTVGKYFYLAMAKGGLNDDHILIVSVQHNIASTLYLDQPSRDELLSWKESVRSYYDSKGFSTIFYEHFAPRDKGVSHHLHMQVVPIPKNLTPDDVSETLRYMGNKYRMRWRFLNDYNRVKEEVGLNEPFFALELPGFNEKNNNVMVTRIEGKIPFQFGRQVLIQILKCPEKEDWKSCVYPQRVEVRITTSFRDNFTPFDFTRNQEEKET